MNQTNEQNNSPKLPKGWILTSIGSIGEVYSGGTPSTSDESNFNGEISWITPADLTKYDKKFIEFGRRNISEKGLSNSSAKLLPKGSVLFSSRAPIGYVVIASRECATNQGFKNLVVSENVFNEYIYYYLKSIKQLAEEFASGTTFKEISAKSFASLPFPLPPLNEQARIVAKIEEIFTKLDAGIAALRQVNKQITRFRQAVLRDAVTGELTKVWRETNRTEPADALLKRILQERRERWEQDQLKKFTAAGKPPKTADWKTKYKQPAAPNTENLPELPDGWTWASIDQIAEVGTGGTPFRGNLTFWKDGTIDWVTSSALNNDFIRKAEEKITEKALAETNVKIFPIHTLLVALYGEGKTRGKISELLIEATTNQACAGIILNQKETSSLRPFVKLFFKKNYEDIRRLSSGGVQPNLNLSLVKETNFPLPPLAEQQKIVEEVERLLSVADATEKTVKQSLKQAERLRQSILKRAFEGKLVSQDDADESAQFLLERIKQERIEKAEETKAQKVKPNKLKPRNKNLIQGELPY